MRVFAGVGYEGFRVLHVRFQHSKLGTAWQGFLGLAPKISDGCKDLESS